MAESELVEKVAMEICGANAAEEGRCACRLAAMKDFVCPGRSIQSRAAIKAVLTELIDSHTLGPYWRQVVNFAHANDIDLK